MIFMTSNSGNSAATGHFGRQMRKEREAHGWTLREFARRTGIDFTVLSRIENGKRPPNKTVADACDLVFPGRRGWFREYYEESKTWTPAGFKDWQEYEDRASIVHDWCTSIVTGLLQTEGYARALLETSPGATPEMVATRLKARLERQHRVLSREDAPRSVFLVDEVALYRLVGSPQIMSVQLGHLLEVAALPQVTVQLLPVVAHPANVSGFVVTDGAVLCEHLRGAYVFTDEQTVTSLDGMFDTLRSECRKASESMALIKEMRETWATGVSPLTRMPTEATA